MQEVLHSPYLIVEVDKQVARITRTSTPFPSVEAVTQGWQEVCAALDKAGRTGRCLLSDLRLGPARNDPAFERAVIAILPNVHRGFVRNAVLVRLAVGALQIRRHAREDGIERLVTDNEEAAYAYFSEALPSTNSRR
jgi:hypothetical protein